MLGWYTHALNLLLIVLQAKDPQAVQPHLKKCFEAIARLDFASDLKISSMESPEGEVMPFDKHMYPEVWLTLLCIPEIRLLTALQGLAAPPCTLLCTLCLLTAEVWTLPVAPTHVSTAPLKYLNDIQGSVEQWLSLVEERMRDAVHAQLVAALAAYATTPRTEWVLQWPAMIVLAVSAVFWSSGVEDAFAGAGAETARDNCTEDLLGLTEVVRGELSSAQRTTLGALITIDVHARDVVADLAEQGVTTPADFEWVKQLRYYWRDDNLFVDMVQVCTQSLLPAASCVEGSFPRKTHNRPGTRVEPKPSVHAGIVDVWLRVPWQHPQACSLLLQIAAT